MGCDPNVDPFFENEWKLCQETWAKKLPANIDILYYRGSDRTKLTRDELHYKELEIGCEDGFEHTYKKTWLVMQWAIQNLGPYDYYFRTNTSTYINLDNLNFFIHKVVQPNIYYASDIYSLSEGYAPYPLCLYARGNGILLSRSQVEIILDEGFNLLYLNQTDDIGIGNVLNSHYIRTDKKGKYYNHIKGIPHTWYNTVNEEFDTGHQLSSFHSSDNHWMAVTTTVKRYREREKEESIYKEFHSLVENLDMDAIESNDLCNAMKTYSDNFNIFIGSILGYISFDEWELVDKNLLYLIEISNKASDDEQHYKYKEIQGKFKDFAIEFSKEKIPWNV